MPPSFESGIVDDVIITSTDTAYVMWTVNFTFLVKSVIRTMCAKICKNMFKIAKVIQGMLLTFYRTR